jgi:hypothetical protein
MPARRKILLPVCAAIILGMTTARAEPLPWPKPPGSCAHGYFMSNGYCVPSQGAQTAIPKHGGSCPWGWTSSGDFCLKSGDTIPRGKRS